MPEPKKHIQVNVDFTNVPELLEALERMVADDMTDRSKFIKRLIRQERDRRHELALAAERASRGKGSRISAHA